MLEPNSWQGRILQLKPERGVRSLAEETVEMWTALDGTLTIHWGGKTIPWAELPERPKKAKPTLLERVATHKPPHKPSKPRVLIRETLDAEAP